MCPRVLSKRSLSCASALPVTLNISINHETQGSSSVPGDTDPGHPQGHSAQPQLALSPAAGVPWWPCPAVTAPRAGTALLPAAPALPGQ